MNNLNVLRALFLFLCCASAFNLRSHDFPNLLSTPGTFPTNPNYGNVKYYSDSDCNDYTSGQSILLDTCLVSKSGAALMYTCSKDKPTHTRTFSNIFPLCRRWVSHFCYFLRHELHHGQWYRFLQRLLRCE
jgi:hypothetical protein